MPKRTDIKRVLVIGSGPIVIGQACEFDYSGTQACKALRSEGLEVVLVNSNPATIMTDPELADQTYIEPLTPEVVEAIIAEGAARRGAADRRRPDRAQPGGGAARARHPGQVRREADRRVDRRDQGGRGPAAVPQRDGGDWRRGAGERRRQVARRSAGDRRHRRLSRHHPPVLHAGRRRRRHRLQHRGVPRAGRPGPGSQPGARDPGRGVGDRLERVRARGDARRRRQLRGHLLDREHRPDGRPHRRLDHGGAGADADRQGIPADAGPGAAHHHPRRRRDRRVEHPVRDQPRRRPHRRHRDEPARVAVLGAGVEGHRVPDREDRRQAGARLPPRRDPERHHAADAGVVRADHRLRGGEVPALELREVPAGRPDADHADEVGGRGDGHRPHLQGGVPEGGAVARARQARHAVPHRPRDAVRGLGRGRQRAAAPAGGADRSPDVGAVPRAAARLDRRHAARADEHRPVVPRAVPRDRRAAADGRPGALPGDDHRPAAHAEARRLQRRGHRRRARRGRERGAPAPARGRAGGRLQAHRHLRGRVRVVHAVHVRQLRAGVRGRADARAGR